MTRPYPSIDIASGLIHDRDKLRNLEAHILEDLVAGRRVVIVVNTVHDAVLLRHYLADGNSLIKLCPRSDETLSQDLSDPELNVFVAAQAVLARGIATNGYNVMYFCTAPKLEEEVHQIAARVLRAGTIGKPIFRIITTNGVNKTSEQEVTRLASVVNWMHDQLDGVLNHVQVHVL